MRGLRHMLRPGSLLLDGLRDQACAARGREERPHPRGEHLNATGHIRRLERSGCSLVQQWLKDLMIVAIDQRHVDGRALESLRCGHAAKATADDHDARSLSL